MQALYEIDCAGHDVERAMARLRSERGLSEEALSFGEELVRGVLRNKSELDGLIRKFAPAFPVEQMSVVDRNILRLAIFEILFDDKTPFKVAINEAVELAKSFGSESSPRLVNGVLGEIVEERNRNQEHGERAEG